MENNKVKVAVIQESKLTPKSKTPASRITITSGQQCSHSGGVCPQIQGRQCGAYVGAVEEMMCVVCVDVTEGT